MKFLISMADVEDEWNTLSREEQERVSRCHDEFQRALGERYVGCWGVRPSGEATTVRLRTDGRYDVVPGLMSSTKEPMGGFYIIDVESLEEAVEWAKRGRFRPGPNEVRALREG